MAYVWARGRITLLIPWRASNHDQVDGADAAGQIIRRHTKADRRMVRSNRAGSRPP